MSRLIAFGRSITGRSEDERPVKHVLSVLTALLLTACASEAGYREIVESWVGAKEADLLASVWGPPERIYEIPGGVRILTYSKSKSSLPVMPRVMIGRSGTSISTALGPKSAARMAR